MLSDALSIPVLHLISEVSCRRLFFCFLLGGWEGGSGGGCGGCGVQGNASTPCCQSPKAYSSLNVIHPLSELSGGVEFVATTGVKRVASEMLQHKFAEITPRSKTARYGIMAPSTPRLAGRTHGAPTDFGKDTHSSSDFSWSGSSGIRPPTS